MSNFYCIIMHQSKTMHLAKNKLKLYWLQFPIPHLHQNQHLKKHWKHLQNSRKWTAVYAFIPPAPSYDGFKIHHAKFLLTEWILHANFQLYALQLQLDKAVFNSLNTASNKVVNSGNRSKRVLMLELNQPWFERSQSKEIHHILWHQCLCSSPIRKNSNSWRKIDHVVRVPPFRTTFIALQNQDVTLTHNN